MLSSVLLLLFKLVGSGLFRFFLLNGLDKNFLILEHITLSQHIELMIQSLINLPLLAEFPQKSSESSLSPHPQNFSGHPRVASTFPFSDTAMPAFPFFQETLPSSVSRVDSDVLFEDEAVLDEFFYVVAGSGEADFTKFFVIHPHTVFSALKHAGGESSLESERYHELYKN